MIRQICLIYLKNFDTAKFGRSALNIRPRHSRPPPLFWVPLCAPGALTEVFAESFEIT